MCHEKINQKFCKVFTSFYQNRAILNKVIPLNLSVISPVIHRIPVFRCNVWAVPPYHFQLDFLNLHLTVTNYAKPTAKTGGSPLFYLQSFSTNRESWFKHTAELSSNV